MTDLSSYLNGRTKAFSGRGWVFDRIGTWLDDPAGARVFLLTGRPGTGKTAIAARVAQMNVGDVPPAHPALDRDRFAFSHFCQAGVESTLSPVSFVRSLSESLGNRYPSFREALQNSGSRQIVINAVQNFTTGSDNTGVRITVELRSSDARPLFDEAVRRPLQAMAATLPPDERIAVLIDSLDEALAFSADSSIPHLLKLANDFPPQVRFFLTCRTNSERVFDLVGPRTLDLLADVPNNLDEVQPYVWAQLAPVPEPDRTTAAARIAAKSEGNFLYAHHVVSDLLARGTPIGDADTQQLPDSLEGVYRQYLERQLGANRARWNDAYRPLLGPIAVARGEGLTRAQLLGITKLAEDTASDVFEVCAPFLVGGDTPAAPYRIYHQSFREFLLDDDKFTVYPAERHAAIAQYLQNRCGASWGRCDDQYALRYTPAHWADAAALSEAQRDVRTLALIGVASDRRYQQRFESRVADLPMLHSYLHRAVQVAALNDGDDMLPAIVKASRQFIQFRREYLRAESVVALAAAGKLDQAEARLPLFTDVDQDWQTAARLILAWIAAAHSPQAALALRQRAAPALPVDPTLQLLELRVDAAFAGAAFFPAQKGPDAPLEFGRQLVNRISGQQYDSELLQAMNASLMMHTGQAVAPHEAYASHFDAPVLVGLATQSPVEGTALLDEYVDAHAGYNYVEYRNRSLWNVVRAVLVNHERQDWVLDRLRRIVVAALSGGGVDFEEMLPLSAALLAERARGGAVGQVFHQSATDALQAAAGLQHARGANDSWGTHRRRLATLMELAALVLGDAGAAGAFASQIQALPSGFAGFLAPAHLRFADALRVCRLDQGGAVDQALQDALRSAHHIQDYHFCARVTARCNAMIRWHRMPLQGAALTAAIERLVRATSEVEFAADHVVHDPFVHRANDPSLLSIASARDAATIEDLVEVFQRSAVEFRRLNPQYAIGDVLQGGTLIHVPDPGFAPLLAVHLAARVLTEPTLADERVPLVRSLVPIAAGNPTTLDTVLSYLIVTADLQDAQLVDDIGAEAGPVVFVNVPAPGAQIGPDAVMPA